MESQGTATRSSPNSWQLERACAQQWRPSIAKMKLKQQQKTNVTFSEWPSHITQLKTFTHLLSPYPKLFDISTYWGFPGGANGKESACQCRTCKRHGFNPWVGKNPWSRKWQPAPAFLPGKVHGQRSLVGYSPWGHKELDMTERAGMHPHTQSAYYYLMLHCFVWVHPH